MAHDYVFRFVLLGDSFVGKTRMIMKFTQNETYSVRTIATISMDFYTQNVTTIDGLTVKLQIWDAPGLKRLRSSVRSSYKSIAAALLVYDVTNRESFENLREWIQELRDECPNEEIVLMLTGNKKDLESERKINDEEAKLFMIEENLHGFAEVSSLEGDSIEDVFSYLATKIGRMLKNGVVVPSRSSGISGSLFEGSPRTRTMSQLSLKSQYEINSASSTPDFFQNRSFRQSWASKPFMRFGSIGGTNRHRPTTNQNADTPSISGKLESVKSGMRKAGSLSSIMDKFWRSGESKRANRVRVDILYDDEEEEDRVFPASVPNENSRVGHAEKMKNSDERERKDQQQQQEQRKGSPSLLSISESKEAEQEICNSQTLPKPRRKLFSGKMPSIRKMSNSLKRKSRKQEIDRQGTEEEDEEEERGYGCATDGKEMVETQDARAQSQFEYADIRNFLGMDRQNSMTFREGQRTSMIEVKSEISTEQIPRRSMSLVEFDDNNDVDILSNGYEPGEELPLITVTHDGNMRYSSEESVKGVEAAIPQLETAVTTEESLESDASTVDGDSLYSAEIAVASLDCINAADMDNALPLVGYQAGYQAKEVALPCLYTETQTSDEVVLDDTPFRLQQAGDYDDNDKTQENPTRDPLTETDEVDPKMPQEYAKKLEKISVEAADIKSKSSPLPDSELVMAARKALNGFAKESSIADLKEGLGEQLSTSKDPSITEINKDSFDKQISIKPSIFNVNKQISLERPISNIKAESFTEPLSKERSISNINEMEQLLLEPSIPDVNEEDGSAEPSFPDICEEEDVFIKTKSDSGSTKSMPQEPITSPSLEDPEAEDCKLASSCSAVADAALNAIPPVVKPTPTYSTLYSFNTRYNSHFNKFHEYRRLSSYPLQNGIHSTPKTFSYLDIYSRQSLHSSSAFSYRGNRSSSSRPTISYASQAPHCFLNTRSSSVAASYLASPTAAYLSGYEKAKRFSLELTADRPSEKGRSPTEEGTSDDIT